MIKALFLLLAMGSLAMAQDVQRRAPPPAPPATAKPSPILMLTDHLYAGRVAEAVAQLSKYAAAQPDDQEGQYALGAARFVRAVERLGQALYRHGLVSPGEVLEADMGPGLPFLRFPVPFNPRPEPLTFEKVREVLIAFGDDLAGVEEPLSKVTDPKAGLRLNIGFVRLDLDSNGTSSPEESLWRLFASVAGRQIDEASASEFSIRFDAGDAAWMRGYAHLLQAMTNVLLAYDWHEGFDHLFHRFFPRSGLPYAQLDDLLNAQKPLWEAYLKCVEQPGCRSVDRPVGTVDPFIASLSDALSFIHLARWNVIEPQRMARALDHLRSMIAMSRLSWKEIMAETDNDHEWIPNPSQGGPLPGMLVTRELVRDWLAFLDNFEALLEGKALLAHWRFAKGINVRRVFLEPPRFDPILWFQGSAALPYLEDGPLVDSNTWEQMSELFRANFLSYALWFN